MEKKSEKLIVVGKSGSGKDWLLRQVEKNGLKICLKTTTRPPRINENDYNFIDVDSFMSLLEENKLITHQSFNLMSKELDPVTWYYGILKEDFENNQAFIMTPYEVSKLDPDIRKKCFVVYLDIDRSVRESRISGRNDFNDSVKRRLDADEVDFFEFFDYDLKITDPEFDPELVIDLMY